jgi:hypothetical protein
VCRKTKTASSFARGEYRTVNGKLFNVDKTVLFEMASGEVQKAADGGSMEVSNKLSELKSPRTFLCAFLAR